jgi:DNA replication licensing factor MCM2
VEVCCRQGQLNKLVCTTGVVTRRTNVFPQLQQIKFDCGRCGYMLGPFFQHTGEAEVKPNSCPQCQGKGPFNVRPLRVDARRSHPALRISTTAQCIPDDCEMTRS